MELFAASRQWATRPADQRFSTLEELYTATKRYAETAQEVTKNWADLRAEASEEDVMLVGKGALPARLTNWAFGQLCWKIGAPAPYLRELPPTLAAQNLNHGLKRIETDQTAAVLFHANGSLLVRAMTSEKYSRVWNHEVVSRLLPMKELGWRVPPARPALDGTPGTRLATPDDVLEQGGGLSIKVGDWIAPAGLYASDHDMFVFLVNEGRTINADPESQLSRGIFVSNSEVGAASLRLTRFLYRHVCGNHIVWGASNVTEISIRHVGSIDAKAEQQIYAEIKKYADESTSDETAKIGAARQFLLGASKTQVLDKLFGIRSLAITRKALTAAYDSTIQHVEDGDPNTAWGMANGLSRISQETNFADQRTALDRAAGRVLALSF